MTNRPDYRRVNSDVSEAQAATDDTRKIAEDREGEAIRRAEFESYHRGAEIDLGFKQGAERSRLKGMQEERDGAYRQSLLDEQKQLDHSLEAGGLRKFVRDLSGRSDADRTARENVQLNIESMQQREQEETAQLQAKHDREERERVADMQQRAAYIAQQQEQENQTRIEQQRQQSEEARASVTPVNMNEVPSEIPWKQPAIEQQNQSDSELRAAYIETNQIKAPEPPQDRAVYIAEQQSQMSEPQNTPTQEFQRAAPVQSHGHER